MNIERTINLYLADIIAFSERLNAVCYLYFREVALSNTPNISLKEEQFIYDNDLAKKRTLRIENEYESLLPYVQAGNIKVSSNLKDSIIDVIDFLKSDLENAEKLGSVLLNKQQIEDFSKKQIQRLEMLLRILEFKN